MRVNPNIAPNILNALFQTQDQEQTALEQLSTQKRVNVPSDDPLAAAQVVANQDQTAQAAQYLQNIDTLTVQMQTADSALSSVVTALTQAINIGVQGSDGTLPATNLQQLAQTVQSIQSQLVQLGNTSISGTYLFGGTATTTPPFTLDPSSASGVRTTGTTTSIISTWATVLFCRQMYQAASCSRTRVATFSIQFSSSSRRFKVETPQAWRLRRLRFEPLSTN